MSAPITRRTARARGSALMAVLVLVLAGCSSAASSSASSTTPSSSPSASPSSPAGSPSASASSPSPSVPTSESSPSPSTSTTPTVGPTSPATVTTVVISVQGCPKGCRIFAEQDGTATLPLATPWQVSALVIDGRVTLRIPVATTRGLHFAVTCPGDTCNSSNAQPVVVMRYRGIAVGAAVSDAVAKSQGQASPCWAGTLSASAALTLHVTAFPDQILDRKAHSIRAWMSPQSAVVPGTWYDTYRGGLGTQDVVLC